MARRRTKTAVNTHGLPLCRVTVPLILAIGIALVLVNAVGPARVAESARVFGGADADATAPAAPAASNSAVLFGGRLDVSDGTSHTTPTGAGDEPGTE